MFCDSSVAMKYWKQTLETNSVQHIRTAITVYFLNLRWDNSLRA